MSQYCELCNMSFKSKINLERHKNTNRHKNQSKEDTVTYRCVCGKFYAHRPSFYRHKKTCNYEEVSKNTTEPENIIRTLQEKLEKRDQEMEKKDQEMDELKKKVEMLESSQKIKKQTNNNTTNTTNCNNKTNNTNNFNFNINVFGQENADHIDDKTFVSIMEHVYKAIPLLVKVLHFDKDHPENNNIKITNKKLPYAKVMGENKKWKMVDKKDAIENMMNNGYNLLDEKYDENKEELSAFKQQCFEDFQEKYENDDKKVKKQIKTEVELMVINESKDSK